MKQLLLTVALLAVAVPAPAQFSGVIRGIQKAKDQAARIGDLKITAAEQRAIGERVSLKVRERYGVVQDPAVHKYVSLVGGLVAGTSEAPNVSWTFIVLDTDGVNAFASPGGFVHVTRGALGLLKSESELAAVLAHEVAHVAHEHALDAIKKSTVLEIGTEQILADRQLMLDAVVNRMYDDVLDSSFGRDDEFESDAQSVKALQMLGYAPGALASFLSRLDDRNRDQATRNGLFASHPETLERITRVRRLAGSRTGALGDARYRAEVTYPELPLTSIAPAPDEVSALTGSPDSPTTNDKKATERKEEPRRRGFGLGVLKQTVAPEKQSTQVTASGGARGVGADRLAQGGSNPKVVTVTITLEELTAFKSGIV